MHRIGETNTANNGQKMTIIAYRCCNDIDIQFEDGTIVANKNYTSFKKGEIKNPNYYTNKYLGETNIGTNGQKMAIIAYRCYNDIDVQFEDGVIVTNKDYSSFKRGKIRNPSFSSHPRVGETNIASNGQKMTIIAYRCYKDIDIQFEDGTIVASKDYVSFKKGWVKNPNYNPYNSRLGEVGSNSDGQRMAILSYKSSRDIDIQFEDGTIVTSRNYASFKKGEIKNPNYNPYNSRLGEVGINNNGQKMTIIDYRGSHDIDIQFEDGTIVTNMHYTCFKKGGIKNPNFSPYSGRLGETNTSSSGQKMTIIAYRDSQDIDVQFEDGTVVTNYRYRDFKNGWIRNPNYYNKYLGEINTATNGQKMTIIAYRGYDNIDIQFEDGTIVRNKNYSSFKIGSVSHPAINTKYVGILKDHKLLGLAYKLRDKSVYYYCECTKCGNKDILSPQQILSYICRRNTISQ